MYRNVSPDFVLLAFVLFIGWIVWLCVRWIHSLRAPAIWVPVTAKVTKIHEVVQSSEIASLRLVPSSFSRSHAIYSAEYVVNGTAYSIRTTGSPDVQVGDEVSLVYLERKPSEWRKRSQQPPGRETNWEIKVVLGFALVMVLGVFASVTIALLQQGYSWDEALRWYRTFTF